MTSLDCPACGAGHDGWRGLHRHLADAHASLVVRDDGGPQPAFHVTCPRCPWRFEQTLRGRRGADFLDEFAREITLVCFDQLIMHWVESHGTIAEPAAMGGDSGDSERV